MQDLSLAKSLQEEHSRHRTDSDSDPESDRCDETSFDADLYCDTCKASGGVEVTDIDSERAQSTTTTSCDNDEPAWPDIVVCLSQASNVTWTDKMILVEGTEVTSHPTLSRCTPSSLPTRRLLSPSGCTPPFALRSLVGRHLASSHVAPFGAASPGVVIRDVAPARPLQGLSQPHRPAPTSRASLGLGKASATLPRPRQGLGQPVRALLPPDEVEMAVLTLGGFPSYSFETSLS
eukprot:2895187-Rhodomonas_salina.2